MNSIVQEYKEFSFKCFTGDGVEGIRVSSAMGYRRWTRIFLIFTYIILAIGLYTDHFVLSILELFVI
jgi:hypothetical protein